MTASLLTRYLSWFGALLVIAGCLWPVLGDWSGSVVAPFGGIDAMLQLGLLEWTARIWQQPAVWVDLPIFHPESGTLGYMDSLLGQAWLVLPVRWLLNPTAAGLYNWAFLGSLATAFLAAGLLWRATQGCGRLAGVFALAVVGAPYTQAQLGHLNQLPPPFVLLSLAAVIMALRRQEAGADSRLWWWSAATALVLQAAWGWYGFAHAMIGMAVVTVSWLTGTLRGGRPLSTTFKSLLRYALPAAVPALFAVYLLAQPQLNVADRYDEFTRDSSEVRAGSADIQHMLNRGVYRGELSDWFGHGRTGADRYEGRARQVLNPGWVALALAVFGWTRRGRLDPVRRRWGTALLAVGGTGLVLAFGDSIGVPGTDTRLPLPLEWLRTVVPPFRAFRGAWRFSWLLTIAVAWWAALGVEGLLASGRRAFWAPVAVALLIVVSLPRGVPALAVHLTGRHHAVEGAPRGPVGTVPAPATEYDEDVTEALWLVRALETGRPVTGGATGWVPPSVQALRAEMLACEEGRSDPSTILRRWKAQGVRIVEIALRPGDPRVEFWRGVLTSEGAERASFWPRAGYETWLLD